MPVNRETRPLFCAQIVPKICQEHQNISNDIEIHRNPEAHKNGLFAGKLLYILRFTVFRRFLHTVEVTGSNPLSPTGLSGDTFLSPLV